MARFYPKKLPREQKLKSALISSTGTLFRVSKSPDEGLGDLFDEVQKTRVYEDGKTFVDLVPRLRMKTIKQEYQIEKKDPNFDLRDFVSRHFYKFAPHESKEYHSDTSRPVSEHITNLWSVLERRNRIDRGSLLAVPQPYIVPGGRFSEQFYWDTYFIMLGLAADGRWSDISGMMKNYTFMIRKFGFIPTANRTYFLSRSQPPFFSHMIELLGTHRGKIRTYSEFLPYMLAEYRFWMRGRTKLSKQEHKAFARVIEMPNGVLLNRYYDNKSTPRPESLHEDHEVATESGRDASRLYLHLRAGAESGWDFSSRWFQEGGDISTIHTADIVPIDLNCLLYHLEATIAETYKLLRNPLLAKKFKKLADKRAEAIQKYCWSEKDEFYEDYNFHHGAHTKHITLAAAFPLYVGIASQDQADKVAARLKKDFLKSGGLVTTLVNNGQQWDAPNGWAPLQWVAIVGLRKYGHDELADEIKNRWVTLNNKVYKERGKLVEKYNVEDDSGLGGGGEYPLQDGFGWTNGVLAALLEEDSK